MAPFHARHCWAAITDAEYGVWDIMPLLPDGLPPLDGVVSLETFRDRLVTMDLAGKRLILETEASFIERTSRMAPVPARIATGLDGSHLTLFLQGRLSDSEDRGWFLVDSGNLADVLLGPRFGSNPDSRSVGIVFSEGLEVRASARSADIIYDGALSEALLRQIIVSADLRAGRVWLGLPT